MVVSIVILNESKHKILKVCGFRCETSTGPCEFSLCYFLEMPSQRSKLTFSKSRLLATFNCKMVAIERNSVAKKYLEVEDTL